MEPQKIMNYTELELRIANLRAEKLQLEGEIKRNFKEVIHGLYPTTLIKESLQKVSEDKELHSDLLKTGINVGAGFLIKQLLKKQNIKRFIGATLIEYLSPVLIKNAPNIISGINSWIHLKGDHKSYNGQQNDNIVEETR